MADIKKDEANTTSSTTGGAPGTLGSTGTAGAAGTYSSNPGASSASSSAGTGGGQGYRSSTQSGSGGSDAGKSYDETKERAGQAYDEAKRQASHAQERGKEVYGQARERAEEYYEEATEMASEKYRRAADWASDQYDHASEYGQQGWSATQRFVNENPVLLGVIGLATGLLLGALLPRTRSEDRYMGEWADDVRHRGMRQAREAVDRGRQYASRTFSEDESGHASHDADWRRGTSEEAQAARRSSPIAGQYENKH